MIKRIIFLLMATAILTSVVLYGGYQWTLEQPLSLPDASRALEISCGEYGNAILKVLQA